MGSGHPKKSIVSLSNSARKAPVCIHHRDGILLLMHSPSPRAFVFQAIPADFVDSDIRR